MSTLVLNALIVAGTGALSVRLYLMPELSKRYRAFICYLVFYTLQTGTLMILSRGSDLYEKIYVVSEPVAWILCAWVVLELYSLVLHDYQGLYTVGRWALLAAITLAVVASGIILALPSHVTQHSRVLVYVYLAGRSVYFSLMVFLLTILYFLMQYPVRLPRNIAVHSVIFSIYYLSNTVIFLLLSMLGGKSLSRARYVLLGITLASVGAWLVMLNPVGEKRMLRLRPDWMPGSEEDLVTQLNSLNAALLRATRK
jgi:hypothetical protein